MSLTSYKAVEDILEGITLEDFQCVDLLRALLFKRNIITYDTGMGKTVLTAAIMRALVNEVPTRRFIMIVENSQLGQTPQQIRKWANLSVLTVTAQTDDIEASLIKRNFLRYQVLMLTKETLNDYRVMNILYKYKDSYHGIFIDEAHKLSNFTESSSALMLRGLLRNFEYRYALTATPITSKGRQLADITHMFEWELAWNVKALIKDIERGESLLDKFPNLFINRTRRDLGIISNYRTHIELVEPHDWQKTSGGYNSINVKGPGARNQISRVINIIRKHKGQKGLIYINKHAIREWVVECLEKEGIRVASVHGKMGAKKHELRAEIYKDFADGNLDVLTTSITTGLDLEADYVIFVEFCTDIKQMMGRAERGLNPKTLDLYFIFTRDTGEVEYFLQNIYQRSLSIQEVLRKDYSELIRVGARLTSMQ